MTSIAANSTFATRYIDALPEGTQLEHFGDPDRPTWTKCDGEWVGWQGIIPTSFVHAVAGRLLTWPGADAIPSWPSPFGIDLPSWADDADEWKPVDDTWHRTASRTFGSAEFPDAVVIICPEIAHRDGTIEHYEAQIEIGYEDIKDGAEARAIGRFMVEAGDLIDCIPTQRGAAT